jgi:hypothetical protein
MDKEQTVPIATCATACQLLSYYKLLRDMMSDYCSKKRLEWIYFVEIVELDQRMRIKKHE